MPSFAMDISWSRGSGRKYQGHKNINYAFSRDKTCLLLNDGVFTLSRRGGS